MPGVLVSYIWCRKSNKHFMASYEVNCTAPAGRQRSVAGPRPLYRAAIPSLWQIDAKHARHELQTDRTEQVSENLNIHEVCRRM